MLEGVGGLQPCPEATTKHGVIQWMIIGSLICCIWIFKWSIPCKRRHACVSCPVSWLVFVVLFFFSGCSDDMLDEATRHHLFTDTFCRVCWAVLPFESQRMSHYEVAWKGGFLLASSGALVCLRFLHGVRKGCLKSFPKLMLGLDISQTWRLWMMRVQW